MQEVGVNWALVGPNNQLWKRIKEGFEYPKVRVSCNEHDVSLSKKQWGGTGIITQGKLSHYPLGAVADLTGLGRWTWARYQGKGNMALRVVSIYQPCANNTGTLSVAAQHKAYFQSQNQD